MRREADLRFSNFSRKLIGYRWPGMSEILLKRCKVKQTLYSEFLRTRSMSSSRFRTLASRILLFVGRAATGMMPASLVRIAVLNHWWALLPTSCRSSERHCNPPRKQIMWSQQKRTRRWIVLMQGHFPHMLKRGRFFLANCCARKWQGHANDLQTCQGRGAEDTDSMHMLGFSEFSLSSPSSEYRTEVLFEEFVPQRKISGARLQIFVHWNLPWLAAFWYSIEKNLVSSMSTLPSVYFRILERYICGQWALDDKVLFTSVKVTTNFQLHRGAHEDVELCSFWKHAVAAVFSKRNRKLAGGERLRRGGCAPPSGESGLALNNIKP